MTFAAIRVAVAREDYATEQPLTAEEQLMVAPPDVAAADPDVAQAELDDKTDTPELFAAQLSADADAVTDTIETVRAAGNEVGADGLLIAQERLNVIYERYGISSKRFSREEFTGGCSTAQQAQQMISEGEDAARLMRAAATEGINEFVNRVAVNAKNLFRWAGTYGKEARNVAVRAAKTTGVPSKAVYNNRLRIAHFTNAKKQPLTTADAFGGAVSKTIDAVTAVEAVSNQLASSFSFFKKGHGNLSMRQLFGDLEPTTDSKGKPALSITGTSAIFGEEATIEGVDINATSNNLKELAELMKGVKFSVTWHWKVKDLPANIDLPVMSAKEVAKNAAALVKIADSLVAGYSAVRSMANDYQAMAPSTSVRREVVNIAVDYLTNREVFKFRRAIAHFVQSAWGASDLSINNLATGLNCLMDYYKWCLNQHEETTA